MDGSTKVGGTVKVEAPDDDYVLRIKPDPTGVEVEKLEHPGADSEVTSQNNRDSTQAFESRFTYVNEFGERCRKQFRSWELIADEIEAFSAESSSTWSVHSSKLDEYGGYAHREYRCKRKGYRRKLSRGIRCKTSIATNCPAVFTVYRRYVHYPPGQGPYNVGPKYVVVHNHDCNELEHRMDAKQRRLTSEEEAEVIDLIENHTKPTTIIEHVEKKFHKFMTPNDVVNIRWRINAKRNNPGLRSAPCEGCGKTFTQNGALYAHMRTVHDKDSSEESKENSSSRSESMEPVDSGSVDALDPPQNSGPPTADNPDIKKEDCEYESVEILQEHTTN